MKILLLTMVMTIIPISLLADIEIPTVGDKKYTDDCDCMEVSQVSVIESYFNHNLGNPDEYCVARDECNVAVLCDFWDGPEEWKTSFKSVSINRVPATGCSCNDQANEADNSCGRSNWEWTDQSKCEYECKCDRIEMAREEWVCGGPGWSIIDYETCTVECVSEGGCDDERAALQRGCEPFGIAAFDLDTCVGACNTNCESQWDKLIEECKRMGTTLATSRVSDCWGTCNDPPKDCEEFRNNCETGCKARDGIKEYFCDTEISSGICVCNDVADIPPDEDPEDPTPPDPPDLPTEDPDEPDPDPDPTEDPNGGDHEYTNSLLESIDENTESAVQNSKLTVERLDSTNQILNNIAENEHATASNTGKILDAINQLDDRELTVDNSGVIDAVNDVEDAIGDLDLTLDGLDDITEGTYTPGQLGDAYAITPETTNGFADRLSQFFTTVQTTGLFSLANSLTVGIPTSGTSTMTISAGQYGTHQYDFAAMGNALLTLRYVLLTVFGWVAIRIVLLKR